MYLQITDPVSLFGGLSSLEKLLFVSIIIVFLLGCWALLDLSFKLMHLQKLRLLKEIDPAAFAALTAEPAPKPTLREWLREKLTDRVPVGQEAVITLDHEYDGIRELDNNLPPWWKGVFYASMVFAPIYIYVNHFSGWATGSAEAYALEMQAAEADVRAYLATQEDAVDENSVALLTDNAALGKGAAIYVGKCAACHGAQGEGGIGPNLTDRYWLHGGEIGDVFRTVKYGVPDKGMIAWKNELRPRDIQEVASYIISLVGTEPPNAKEPQGELYADGSSN